MSKTTTVQVAANRANSERETVYPAEVARGTYIKNPPGAQALKLLHLMIGVAGGRMGDDVQHQFRLSEIRKIEKMRNHDRASIEEMISDLAAIVLIHDDTEKQRVTISGIVDEGAIDYRHEISGDLLVTWTFRRAFQRMAAASEHWAIIDRQAVFNMKSRYSILLFQHISSLTNYRYIKEKTFSIPELRAIFGIEPGKVKRFFDLKRDVLSVAIDEISHISSLKLTATPQKIGRTVGSVRIEWAEKDGEAKAATARELKGHSTGRKARRDGTAEVVAEPVVFPETGGITYSPRWLDLKRAAGCNMDNAEIATRFRRFLSDRGIKRDSANIEKLFSDFCAKVGRV